MGTRYDVIEAQFVEIDGQPFKVEVLPSQPASASSLATPQARELATKQVLDRVPSVRDLPTWEDGAA